MRIIFLTISAAAGLAVGCTGPGSPGTQGGMGWASNSAPGQPTVQQASWGQKLMAPFAATPAAIGANHPSPADIQRRQALDPISLGFKSSSDSPKLYVAMAEMAHRGGNVDQARQLYQKALSIDPKNAPALLSAARMEDREGQMDTALSLYHQAAAVEPNNPTVLNDLALCLARKGDFAEAHRALDHVVQLEPRKPLYRNNMAKVLIEMNRLDEAAWHLGSVHQPAVVNYNMGVLLHQRGRGQEASVFLTRAIQIDPQMQPARTLLAQLATPATVVASAQQPVIHTAQAPQPAVAATSPVQPTPQTTAPANNGFAPQSPVLNAPVSPPATTGAPAQQTPPAAETPTTIGATTTVTSPALAQAPSRLPEVY